VTPPITADLAARVAPGSGAVVHRKPLTVVVASDAETDRIARGLTEVVEQLIAAGDLSFGPVAAGLQQFVVDHQPTGVAAVLDVAPDAIAFLFDQAVAIGDSTTHRASGRSGWTTVFVEGDSVSLVAGPGPERPVDWWSQLWAGTVAGSGVQVDLHRSSWSDLADSQPAIGQIDPDIDRPAGIATNGDGTAIDAMTVDPVTNDATPIDEIAIDVAPIDELPNGDAETDINNNGDAAQAETEINDDDAEAKTEISGLMTDLVAEDPAEDVDALADEPNDGDLGDGDGANSAFADSDLADRDLPAHDPGDTAEPAEDQLADGEPAEQRPSDDGNTADQGVDQHDAEPSIDQDDAEPIAEDEDETQSDEDEDEAESITNEDDGEPVIELGSDQIDLSSSSMPTWSWPPPVPEPAIGGPVETMASASAGARPTGASESAGILDPPPTAPTAEPIAGPPPMPADFPPPGQTADATPEPPSSSVASSHTATGPAAEPAAGPAPFDAQPPPANIAPISGPPPMPGAPTNGVAPSDLPPPPPGAEPIAGPPPMPGAATRRAEDDESD